MPAIKIEQFGGMLPAWDPHLLPAGQAADSINGYMFSGALTGWRAPKLLRNLTNPAAKYAYRIPAVTQSAAFAYLVFLSQPSGGDTVTIDEYTYTFVSSVNNPNDVKIGASPAATATNLALALTFDNGLGTNAGTLYGNNTQANPSVAMFSTMQSFSPVGAGGTYLPCTLVASPGVGAAYNLTSVAESTGGARTFWSSSNTALKATTTLTGGTNPALISSITDTSNWLEFVSKDTNVVKSQVVNDQFQRYYFASPDQPPMYNTVARIAAGNKPFLLGINPPGNAPIVAVAGGGNNVQLPAGDVTGSSSKNLTANTIFLVPITPVAAMTLQDIQFMPNATDANVNFAAVCYTDTNQGTTGATTPFEFIAAGTIITGITSGAIATSQFVNPPALIPGVPYWVGIMIDTTESVVDGASGLSTSYQFNNTFTNGPPGFAVAGSANQRNVQMWADLQTDDVIEARGYVYTWVSAYGEESGPSPFTVVNGWTSGTWNLTLSACQPPLLDQGTNRNLTTLRLYRTVTSTAGATVYFWVNDIPLGTNTYADTADDPTISQNFQLPSTNYFPPPANLQGLLNLPNGMVVGFVGNEIWFCQPYFPHAWPPGYVVTTDFPIVGLGLTNGAVVACTQASSYVLSGSSPSLISMLKCSHPEPCIGRGSILGNDLGVFYMSPNGLIQVTNLGQSTNITELWITRERWAALTPLQRPRAISLASCYFCFGSTSSTGDVSTAKEGFTIEMNQDNTSFTIWPQPGGHRVGFNRLAAPNGFNIDNIMMDTWTGIGLVVQNGQIYYYDFTDTAPTMAPYTYTSKIFQQNTKKSFAAMKVYFTVPAGTPAQGVRNEAAFSDPSWATLGPTQYGIVRVYADGVLVTAREIWANGEILRIASGFKAEEWQWQFTGRVVISNVQAATSAKELSKV